MKKPIVELQRVVRAALAYIAWLMLIGLGVLAFFAMPWSYRHSLPVILGAGFTMILLTYGVACLLRNCNSQSLSHGQGWFWVYLVLGLGLRIAYLFAVPPVQLSDSLALSVLARNLYEGIGYRELVGAHELLAYRPPGYPMMLAGTMLLTGDRWSAPALLNLTCYVLSALLILDIAKYSVGRRAGLIAAAAFAIWPSGVMMTGRALTELPSLLLLLATAWALLRGQADPHGRWWLIAGVSMGVGSLVRPSMMLMPFLLAVLALLEPSKRISGFKFAAFAGLMAIACVAPWTVRNHMVLDAVVPISTNGGDNFYRANNELASGGFEPHGKQSFASLLPDEVAWNRANMDAGKQWIAENPVRFARLAVRKLALLVGEDAEGAGLSLKRAYHETGTILTVAIALCNAWWLGVWVMVLVGLYRHRSGLLSDSGQVTMMWLVLFLPLVHAVFESQPRYHMPMVGLLVLFAGLAATPITNRTGGVVKHYTAAAGNRQHSTQRDVSL